MQGTPRTIMLSTLSKASAQEVFNQVADHLLLQNKRASDGRKCFYRYAGLACAAGAVMSDEEARELARRRMSSASYRTLVEEQFAPKKHHTLISRLQSVHDTAPLGTWLKRLRGIASHHKLKLSPLMVAGNG